VNDWRIIFGICLGAVELGARCDSGSGFGAEGGEEGGGGVEDVGGGEPGAAELGDAEAHLVELFGGVGVGGDDDLAAEFLGAAEVEVAEVGAGG